MAFIKYPGSNAIPMMTSNTYQSGKYFATYRSHGSDSHVDMINQRSAAPQLKAK